MSSMSSADAEAVSPVPMACESSSKIEPSSTSSRVARARRKLRERLGGVNPADES